MQRCPWYAACKMTLQASLQSSRFALPRLQAFDMPAAAVALTNIAHTKETAIVPLSTETLAGLASRRRFKNTQGM